MPRLIPESPTFQHRLRARGVGAAARQPRRRRRADRQPAAHRRRQGPRGRPRRADARRRHPRAGGQGRQRLVHDDGLVDPAARRKDVRIHPVDQARDAKYAAPRATSSSDPRWGSRAARRVGARRGRRRTPTFGDDFSVPELPRWALHDRDDQADLVDRVRDNALGHRRTASAPPTHDDVDAIVEILTGRLPTSYDVNAEADDRAADGRPADPGAGDDPPGHPAAPPRRGPRRRRAAARRCWRSSRPRS